MSIQQRGYICEKGSTQGKLAVCQQKFPYPHGSTYASSSCGLSDEYQLTLTTLSYSSGV